MRNTQPKFSVIIAFYNTEDYLEEAIEGVIGQSCPDWELLLIDDGSADKSLEIARKYAQKFPEKIFCYQHPDQGNHGVAASRNLGIEKAVGEYLAILDSDDVWLPEKLASQLQDLEQHPEVGLHCEASKYWYSWNDKQLDDVVIPVGSPDGVYKPMELLPLLYPFGPGAAPCPSGIIVKREAAQTIGGFVEAFVGPVQFYEDQAFLVKLYTAFPVFISSAYNNLYRQRQGSQMNEIESDKRYHQARRFFLQWIENYWKENGQYSRLTEGLLADAWLQYRHPMRYRLREKFRRIRQKLNIPA